jgi:hypothetical protein
MGRMHLAEQLRRLTMSPVGGQVRNINSIEDSRLPDESGSTVSVQRFHGEHLGYLKYVYYKCNLLTAWLVSSSPSRLSRGASYVQ